MIAENDDHFVTSRSGERIRVPHEFICPITLELMVSPLTTKHGINFERAAILSWLANGCGDDVSNQCPLTRNVMKPSDLIPHYSLELKIKMWAQRHNVDLEAMEKEHYGLSSSCSSSGDGEDPGELQDSEAEEIHKSFMKNFYGFVSLPKGELERRRRRRHKTRNGSGSSTSTGRSNTSTSSSTNRTSRRRSSCTDSSSSSDSGPSSSSGRRRRADQSNAITTGARAA